ncbi:hypothetical protein MUG84_14300 [Paenibacillus sp. KQZ6P-2]|uniref:Uracil-DNA glycosylase-like domain-containing protein n=1 Tax=Paenibacillus mangrovi TaxID=2931978 RepID=A0A9X1WSU8_9BACL|nr:hypothetical protein [Paenibacillus mangrovi]MCJ8012905.1 hypothetical protein [Paenibacillus mangrovi]
MASLLDRYKPAILSLPQSGEWTKRDLLTNAFRLASEDRLAMYYAPHNEWINFDARVVIIGITPGWTQMKIAVRTAQAGLMAGLPEEEILRCAKREARFAGSMRRHLISMLDCLGLPKRLNIRSSRDLFGEHTQLLHTTSLLKYPVFVGERNYTGANPEIGASPLLSGQALSSMKELGQFPDAILIPLGKAVERVLIQMAEQGHIEQTRILWGFPHPSGANGHRQRQFEENEKRMRSMIHRFFR